jgi:hypothetical protein
MALHARGALPPVITSPAVVGAGRSAALFDGAYAEHASRLARTLRGAVSGAAPVTPPESTEEEQHAGA